VVHFSAPVDIWSGSNRASAAPERFGEFRARCREELAGQADKLNELCARAAEGTATILHGARDRKHNNAAVLAELPSDR
jgi:uncharacterized protein YeaO (DUF488 family)